MKERYIFFLGVCVGIIIISFAMLIVIKSINVVKNNRPLDNVVSEDITESSTEDTTKKYEDTTESSTEDTTKKDEDTTKKDEHTTENVETETVKMELSTENMMEMTTEKMEISTEKISELTTYDFNKNLLQPKKIEKLKSLQNNR